MLYKSGSFCRTFGIIGIMLTASAAQAQFFPFFQQPQQQRPPQSPPPQARPSQPAPTTKATQPAAPSARPASPKAAPATAAAPFGEVRTACSTEIKSTCAGVVPGSADSVQCLRPNFAVHSPPCQAALQRAGEPSVKPPSDQADAKSAGPRGTSDAPRQVSTDRIATPAPQEPVKELKVPTMRPTQEARFVARNCREDHSLLCGGVPYGQVLKCLAGQQTRLTSDCRKALARR